MNDDFALNQLVIANLGLFDLDKPDEQDERIKELFGALDKLTRETDPYSAYFTNPGHRDWAAPPHDTVTDRVLRAVQEAQASFESTRHRQTFGHRHLVTAGRKRAFIVLVPDVDDIEARVLPQLIDETPDEEERVLAAEFANAKEAANIASRELRTDTQLVAEQARAIDESLRQWQLERKHRLSTTWLGDVVGENEGVVS